MSISAIARTAPSPTQAPTATSTSNTTLDRQAFLKLLVAQLRYQDPSKPMDASEMVSQSAQLSVVDKLDEISKALSGSTLNDQLMLGGSLIGKVVAFNDGDGAPLTATVTSARFVNGSLVLSAGEWDVPVAAVLGVAAAVVAPATTGVEPIAP